METVVKFNPVLLVADPTLAWADAEPRTADLWSVWQNSTQNRGQEEKKPLSQGAGVGNGLSHCLLQWGSAAPHQVCLLKQKQVGCSTREL